MEKYIDLLDLPHYEPRAHPRMTLSNRAAQFAPFSALEGLEKAIENIKTVNK